MYVLYVHVCACVRVFVLKQRELRISVSAAFMPNPSHKLPVLLCGKDLFLCLARTGLMPNGHFLACFVVFVSTFDLFLLPAFSFSSQNRFLIERCLEAHLAFCKCIFPIDPPCSMDSNTSTLAAPSHFPSPLLLFWSSSPLLLLPHLLLCRETQRCRSC